MGAFLHGVIFLCLGMLHERSGFMFACLAALVFKSLQFAAVFSKAFANIMCQTHLCFTFLHQVTLLLFFTYLNLASLCVKESFFQECFFHNDENSYYHPPALLNVLIKIFEKYVSVTLTLTWLSMLLWKQKQAINQVNNSNIALKKTFKIRGG